MHSAAVEGASGVEEPFAVEGASGVEEPFAVEGASGIEGALRQVANYVEVVGQVQPYYHVQDSSPGEDATLVWPCYAEGVSRE